MSAIEQGFIQDEIARSAYAYQQQIESKEKIIVGVNAYTVNKEEQVPVFKIDDSIRQVQIEKLNALKNKRDGVKVSQSLESIAAAAKDGTNIMPHVITAVENYCTLGEVADTLRKIFGEYK